MPTNQSKVDNSSLRLFTGDSSFAQLARKAKHHRHVTGRWRGLLNQCIGNLILVLPGIVERVPKFSRSQPKELV